MHTLTVEQLLSLTSGTAVGNVDPAAVIEGCVIDSRQIQSGDAFFALAGSQVHGVTFAQNAVNAGASVVVVDEAASGNCSTAHVSVPDAEYALAQIANHNRQTSDALVVGVTGSVGKTTARRMITAVLETTHVGIQSPLNFNNQLGVPLSLLELQDGDEFAVIEVGTSGPGEIEFLSSVVRPDMAVLTRIAPAHLAGLESLSEIQKEKFQLLKALGPDGVAFLNADDPLVLQLAAKLNRSVVTFGTNEAADVRATSVTMDGNELVVEVNGVTYQVPVFGRHHVTNVLAAIAVGLEVGVSPSQIQLGLARYKPQAGRCVASEVASWTVIDDTYNSSPASVAGAIKALAEFDNCNRRVIVLSDMLDLGDQSPMLHYGVGAALAASSIDHVLVTGEFAADVVEGFITSGGYVGRISQFGDSTTLCTMLDIILGEGDAVLVKGSRATRMEHVVQFLQDVVENEQRLPQAA